MDMQSFTLTDARNRHGEIFDRAATEPILLTKQSRPSHVVLSYQHYQTLLERLQELEDLTLGQAAEKALASSRRVGTEVFTESLKRFADAEA